MLYLLLFLLNFTFAQDNKNELLTPNVPQSSSSESRTQVQKKTPEKIVVTGSYIRRTQAEGPSPISTLDSPLFEKTGSQTVSDLLLESPLFSSSREFSGFYSFHGQGAESTLLLLNGLRIPKLGTPSRSSFNGVRSISAGVIDRVEILKDGSSALYGSDAAAGVINIITKKDYDGAEFSIRHRAPEMGVGQSSTINGAYGKNYSRGQWLASVQYLDAKGFWQEDLGSYTQSRRHHGLASSGYIQTKNSQGALLNQQWLGPVYTKDNGKTKRLKVNRLPFDQVKADRNNLSVFLTGGLELPSQINFNVLALYNRHERQAQDPPFIITYDDINRPSLNLNSIRNSSLKEQLNAGSANNSKAFLPGYTPFEEVGLKDSLLNENSYTLQASLNKDFAETWSWQLESSLGILSEQEQLLAGVVDLEVARSLLDNGTWDPTLPAGSFAKQNSLSRAMTSPQYRYDSQMITSKFVSHGEIFDFAQLWGTGGAAALALGAEIQYESFEDKNDRALTTGRLSAPLARNLKGNRTIQSSFIELTTNPLDQLEFQAAGRFDHYSDVGSTLNSKLALGYRPHSSLLIRSSWGTSFRAPGIRSMALQPFESWKAFPDWIECSVNETCDNDTQRKVQRYKDPKLRPETGEHYNFGFIFQPHRSWSFGLDQWNFLGKNTLTRLFGSDITRFESLSISNNLRDRGIQIQRDENNVLQSIRMPDEINMGSRTVRGVDLNINFRQSLRLFKTPMKLSVSVNHSHIFEKQSEKFYGAIIDKQDSQNWRNIITLGLNSQNHGLRLASRTAAGGLIPNSLDQTFPIHTEYDLNYNWNFQWGGRFNFGVKNLLNSQPPFDLTKSTVTFHKPLRKSFSPLRRIFYTGYTQTF